MALRCFVHGKLGNSLSYNSRFFKTNSGFLGLCATLTNNNNNNNINGFWGCRYYSRKSYQATPNPPNFMDYPENLSTYEYRIYSQQLQATMGFGIDIDLGNYRNIIRPYHGSLDDPKIMVYARFAVEEYNNTEEEQLQLLRIVKANCQLDTSSYYLTLEAINGAGKKYWYQAFVQIDIENQNQMKLISFNFFGDAENPPEPYAKKVYYRLKAGFGGDMCKDNMPFDPITMVKEEDIHARDYFKYVEQVKASQGFDVDDNLCAGFGRGGIYPYRRPLDNSEITAPARFAVEKYNKLKSSKLQFMRVVKANHKAFPGTMYYLTLEAVDAGEKKRYQAKVLVNTEGKELQLFRFVDDSGKPVYLFIK